MLRSACTTLASISPPTRPISFFVFSFSLVLTHPPTYSTYAYIRTLIISHQQSTTASTTAPTIPAPLSIPPSRARRQFAMRLAQRKAELESARDREEEPEGGVGPEGVQEREVREGHERFKRLFEGMDSSDEEGEGDVEEREV